MHIYQYSDLCKHFFEVGEGDWGGGGINYLKHLEYCIVTLLCFDKKWN